MSIIYDALKKVEGSIHKPQEAIVKEDKPKRKKGYIIYAIYAVVACVGFFIASIFFGFLRQRNIPAPPSSSLLSRVDTNTADTNVVVKARPQEEKASKEPQGALLSLVLTGVFFSENECYALINNKIVKESDVIDGATVTKINEDGVTLEANGSAISLSTAASR